MLHEFKVNGEMIEVTVARDGQDWLLGDYKAQILADGRLSVQSPDGRAKIAHSAKVGAVSYTHLRAHET